MSYSESTSETESDNIDFVKHNFSSKIYLMRTTDENIYRIELRGTRGNFDGKLFLTKNMLSDSVFGPDSEYDMSFLENECFVDISG